MTAVTQAVEIASGLAGKALTGAQVGRLVKNYLWGRIEHDPVLADAYDLQGLDIDTSSNEEVAQAFVDDIFRKVKTLVIEGAAYQTMLANAAVVNSAEVAADSDFL